MCADSSLNPWWILSNLCNTADLCQQSDPIEFVENICENMHLFPKEDFLTGDQLMFEYDPEVSSQWLTNAAVF